MTRIADFSIDYIQYLNEDSQLSTSLPGKFSDPKKLVSLYQQMVLTRIFDQKAVTLQRTGKLGTYPSSRGQEAIYVGLADALRPDDVFVPYYRGHATFIQRGMGMHEIYAYWGGDERGNQSASAQGDLPISVPIGTQSCHAAGIAKAIQIRGEKRAVVCSIGDGGTSKGDFYSALNVAGVWQLPLVFLVNNNQWAISTSRERQTAAQTFAQKAIAGGFNGVQVDGNDVIAVSQVIDECLIKARRGDGPTVIETCCFRHCDHTTADDASRYIPQDIAEQEWQKEPIQRLQRYLLAHGHWDEQQQQTLDAQCRAEIETAVEDYLNIPEQDPESMFDYLYAELPEHYQYQRDLVSHYKSTVKNKHG